MSRFLPLSYRFKKMFLKLVEPMGLLFAPILRADGTMSGKKRIIFMHEGANVLEKKTY